MNNPYKLFFIIGIILVVLTPFACFESMIKIVEIDEDEEHILKEMIYYKTEDSIKYQGLIDSLHNELRSSISAREYSIFLLPLCGAIGASGVIFLVLGYKRYQKLKTTSITD